MEGAVSLMTACMKLAEYPMICIACHALKLHTALLIFTVQNEIKTNVWDST
jgi:hypothetical protein